MTRLIFQGRSAKVVAVGPAVLSDIRSRAKISVHRRPTTIAQERSQRSGKRAQMELCGVTPAVEVSSKVVFTSKNARLSSGTGARRLDRFLAQTPRR